MGAVVFGSGKNMIPEIGTHNLANREKWLELALQQIPAGSRILDAGAGELQYKRFCSHLNYVSQDFAKYDGNGNGSGLQVGGWDQSRIDIVSDITSIPRPDSSFDAIMCIEVLEHLSNPVLALHELARLLRRGGQLIVTAPFCSLTHFAPYYYANGFSRYFFETHLNELGFQILDLEENGNYFEYLAQEVRRIPVFAKRFAGTEPRIWEKGLLFMVLKMLERFSRKDKGSKEALHFGCFVRAIKQ